MLLIPITMVYEVYAQLPPPVPHQTTMVFYLQDIATGPNATVTPVAGIKGGDWTYTTFGSIFVVDDPV